MEHEEKSQTKKRPGPDVSRPGFSPMKHKTSEPNEGALGYKNNESVYG